MTVGLRIGAKIGARFGPAIGVGPDPLQAASGGISGVSRDATSNVYVPASATEWTTFLAAVSLNGIIAVPDALWLFQEASGNPADSIASFTLTASGAPSYQQTVSGWTRKAITFADGNAGSLASASASLPDLSAGSMMTLGYITLPAATPAGTRNLISEGTDATPAFANVTNVPRLFAKSGANTASGTLSPMNAVRPITVRHNLTASTMVAFSDAEKVTPTFGVTATGKALKFGAAANTAINGGPLYGCSWFNANAEVSDANLKLLLQGLGWTILW